MKERDDIWLKQWKDSLEDFEEEVPVNGWERLQADLHANDPLGQVEVSKAKVIPFRTWRVVAAAAVVVLIAGAGIWFLASDKSLQVPSIDSPVAQVAQQELPNTMSPIATPEIVKEEAEAPSKEETVRQERIQNGQASQQSVVNPVVPASTPSLSKSAAQTSSSIVAPLYK